MEIDELIKFLARLAVEEYLNDLRTPKTRHQKLTQTTSGNDNDEKQNKTNT